MNVPVTKLVYKGETFLLPCPIEVDLEELKKMFYWSDDLFFLLAVKSIFEWIKQEKEKGENETDCAVKRGTWKFLDDGSATCSECGFTHKNVWDFDKYDSFCRHCGAKMNGENE